MRVFLSLHTPDCLDGYACVSLCTIHASLAKLLVGFFFRCCQAVDEDMGGRVTF